MFSSFPLSALTKTEQAIFNKIRSLFDPENTFLVGGIVRDAFLGRTREKTDFDIVSLHPKEDIRRLHSSLGGTVVVLDETLEMYRLVLTPSLYIDLVKQRNGTIEEDLKHRDFTINAIAIRVGDLKIIDPLGGRNDIKLKRLRLCSENVLLEDPLRVLRAFSISAQCGLEWTERMEQAIGEAYLRLKEIARERINQELLRLFSAPNSTRWIYKMFKVGVFSVLVPEIEDMVGVHQGPYHHLDVLDHSFLALERLESLLSRLPRITRIKNRDFLLRYLHECIGNWPRNALLKWATLFHDIGKPAVRDIKENGKITFYRHDIVGARIMSSRMRELRFSHRQIEFVKILIRLHMRPGDLTRDGTTKRAIYRFFRQAKGEDLAVMLLSWADAWATRGPLNPWQNFYTHRKRLIEMINLSIEDKTRPEFSPLLDGYDVMKILSIPPGPMVGMALEMIREKQFLGEIKTKEEAEYVLKKWWEERKYLTDKL